MATINKIEPIKLHKTFIVECRPLVDRDISGSISDLPELIKIALRHHLREIRRDCERNMFTISDDDVLQKFMEDGTIAFDTDYDSSTIYAECKLELTHPCTQEELDSKYKAAKLEYDAWKREKDEADCIAKMNELKTKYPDIFAKCALDSF